MRKQLIERKGGTRDARLLCVISTKADTPGRFYRLPSEKDMEALKRAKKLFADLRFEDDASSYGIPNEPTPEGKGKGAGRAFSQRNYGMEVFADLYTERQLLTLMTLAKIIRNSSHEHIPETVRILSAFALGRVNDLSMSLCRWLTSIEAVAAANGGQNRMPVVLDFVEVNPFGGSGGDWHGQVDWVARVVEHLMASDLTPGSSVRSSAQNPALPDDSADALITDPPYYDAFPYSDLSDFFFIWLKRALGNELLDFGGELVPKNDEAVVYDVAHGGNEIKDRKFFQREMTRAFTAWRAVTKPNGVGVVVFANKTTAGWEALIQSIIDAGWIATGSWPIDTERPNRQRAIGSAALGSSVHVVCRPREFPDGKVRSDEIGDWRDVLLELPRRIHEWMPRLASEGVVGADAIFACLGPALEIFSRYSRVEKASGENVELGEYLQEVWACVAKEALAMVFDGADATGFESDARLTAMWLWTIKGGDVEPVGDDGGAESSRADDDGEHDNRNANITGYTLEYDAARKIAQGLGASLEELVSLVHVSGETARLLSAAERTKHLFGKEETELSDTSKKHRKKSAQLDMFAELTQSEDADTVWTERTTTRLGETTLDRVHQSMILFAAGRSEALKRFLVEDGVGRDGRFWRLAQALSALFPANSDEKRWVDGVLARKKGLGF